MAEAGGQALAISADVADYEQVTAAARHAEERFGPIDVWVNVAFTSVFAPFSEITAEEFRRVTEVSYLGFVHGTMAALALMRPRGRGYRSQQTEQKVAAGRPDNLLHPVDGSNGHDHGPHGIFDDKSHDRSPQLWVAQHARVSSGLLAGAAVAGAFVAGWRGRRR